MPAYNDGDYIEKTMDSVLEQTYSNWELLICDDGSTDNTKEIIAEYKKKNDKLNRIQYFYQKNADQLNAIINVLDKATGDYVYIMHSDDLFESKDTLQKSVDYMEMNNEYDAIISDLTIVDKEGNKTGILKVDNYLYNTRMPALQLLWLGRNLYNDVPFVKIDVYKKQVYKNYLLWNGPFWLDLDDNSILKVKKVDFPIRKYRIFGENYLDSAGANLNVINGEIRVVTRLLNSYYIPLYKLQYLAYRTFNKFGIGLHYPIIYRKKETKNKFKIIKFVLNKRFSDEEINNNIFLNSLLLFYKNYNSRTIHIKNIDNNTIWYYGKDMRIFNGKIRDNNIEDLYKNLFEEMKLGFNKIEIDDRTYYDDMVNLTKFLCIYPYVRVVVRSKKNEQK